jgi:hypothetical protein
MRKINYLSLQANIICLLLALISSTAIIKHPNWFGGTSEVAVHLDLLASRVAQMNP